MAHQVQPITLGKTDFADRDSRNDGTLDPDKFLLEGKE